MSKSVKDWSKIAVNEIWGGSVWSERAVVIRCLTKLIMEEGSVKVDGPQCCRAIC